MSHYLYSHPISATELKERGVFTTIEVRKHNQEELAHQGSREFFNDVSKSWNYKISWKACAEKDGHLLALCNPECLPQRLALLSAILELGFLQDDVFENTTNAQRESSTQDGMFESVLQQKGLPTDALAKFPKLKKDCMEKFLDKDPSLASWIPQEVDRVATAPPRDRMKYDTMESYMDERLRDGGMNYFYDLCAYGMDLKLNEQEKERARLPILAIQKAFIYSNDFFSWAKEKAEHEALSPDKDIFSAVALLMREHGVSESKALDMVREKVIGCEKEHFAEVSQLERAGPISENLYRYFDMVRLNHSGSMLWNTFADRYNKHGLAQSKGEAVARDPAEGN